VVFPLSIWAEIPILRSFDKSTITETVLLFGNLNWVFCAGK
jgi:hypothetical protein